LKKEGVRQSFLEKIFGNEQVNIKECVKIIQLLLENQNKETGWSPLSCLSIHDYILLQNLCKYDIFIRRKFVAKPKNNMTKEVLQEIIEKYK